MVELVRRVARCGSTALLPRESGTARNGSRRRSSSKAGRGQRPCVVVECSGLTETLFGSGLFGYDNGACTGANQREIGRVESASGGARFLDEVGDIPLSRQVKLLRLQETSTFRRIGGVDTLRADFRLSAAAHRDLEDRVERGRFRRGLHDRLSVFQIHLPAWRENIGLVAETLLARLAPGRACALSKAARAWLEAYGYPGNIRELCNILERAMPMADGDTVLEAPLPPELLCEPCRCG